MTTVIEPYLPSTAHHEYFKTLCAALPLQTVNYVERDGTWHHLAVTWSAANHGLTQIYYDGMLSEYIKLHLYTASLGML